MNEAEDLERVQEVLAKIIAYQHEPGNGAAVSLEELLAAGAVSLEDKEFMETRSIQYKPHALNDYHAMDMFEIPTGSGCVFIGPAGPPLPKHTARISDFSTILERVLKVQRPADEILLHVELTEDDGVGIAPGSLCFVLRKPDWRSRAIHLKSVAAEHGLAPHQDSPDLHGNYILSFSPTSNDPSTLVPLAMDFLRRGLGLAENAEITYCAGALEDQ